MCHKQDKKGKQQAETFHVDDLKSTHRLPEVNDDCEKWLNKEKFLAKMV